VLVRAAPFAAMSTNQRPSRNSTCRVSRTCSTTGAAPGVFTTRCAVTITYPPVTDRGASGEINATGTVHCAVWCATTIAVHACADGG